MRVVTAFSEMEMWVVHGVVLPLHPLFLNKLLERIGLESKL